MIRENGKVFEPRFVLEPGPDWGVCESCGKEKPDVEPFRHDSRPEGIKLCTDCADSIMDEQEKDRARCPSCGMPTIPDREGLTDEEKTCDRCTDQEKGEMG